MTTQRDLDFLIENRTSIVDDVLIYEQELTVRESYQFNLETIPETDKKLRNQYYTEHRK